ncbi:MAG: hypothetical protein EXR92_04795 [Gemmatimonadetes bacterium]|nr:hypothetical protein [Gemmatimonadota bacterium]
MKSRADGLVTGWTTFHLPPGIVPDGTPAVISEGSGAGPAKLMLAQFSRPGAEGLVASLLSAGPALQARPIKKLVATLGRVGKRLLDRGDPLRAEAEARLPTECGLSHAMVQEVIDGMAREWTPERLDALLAADFPDPLVLDGFRPGPRGDLLRAVGGRFALHVGAGNVPGVGVTSLFRSLLVKCPVLLKPGRGDIALSCLAARGIAEEDEALASALAVVYWPGDAGGALEEVAIREADRVVAYGGPVALSRLRERIPASTPLVPYPHRVSMGVVAREALTSPGAARAVATEAARAVAFFDQRGCVSPQAIWVEGGEKITPQEWAAFLADELEGLAKKLPQGSPAAAVASMVHQLRGSAELRKAAGSGDQVFAPPRASWTVLYEPDSIPFTPCGGRTVRVRPLESLDRLPEVLYPFRGLLQTLAVAGGEAARSQVAEIAAACGVTRVTTFREQPFPPSWWRHDGQGPLLALVRWVSLES